MDDRICPKCGKEFAKPCLLQLHQRRKTPCEPRLEQPRLEGEVCTHCGRAFASRNTLNRHIRNNCAEAAKNREAEDSYKTRLARLEGKYEELLLKMKPGDG